MILVDTSVLIDFLRGEDNESVSLFDEILERKIPYGINEFIYQEVLQGTKSIVEYKKLKNYLETLAFYYLLQGRESYARAALMNFTCRRSGITGRSTIDLLIAETAIENNLFLFHKDSDFDNIAAAFPDLKIYKGLSTRQE
jgi:predicted nucleic acid-binding protein